MRVKLTASTGDFLEVDAPVDAPLKDLLDDVRRIADGFNGIRELYVSGSALSASVNGAERLAVLRHRVKLLRGLIEDAEQNGSNYAYVHRLDLADVLDALEAIVMKP